VHHALCGVCYRAPVVGPELSVDPMVRARDAMSRGAGLFITANCVTGHRTVTEGHRFFRDNVNIPLLCVIHAAQTGQLFPYGGNVPAALIATPVPRTPPPEDWTISLPSTLLLTEGDLEEPEREE